jgi:hypothetical protein
MKAKKGRMLNNEPDPWANYDGKDNSKPACVSLYRLANVVFSDECQIAVSNRVNCLTRAELDVGLKTDQRTFDKVASEYNKKDVPFYDDIQYPEFTVTATKNIPSNFEEIDWEITKKDLIYVISMILNHLSMIFVIV